MKEYTYLYLCSDSSEVRGRRDSHSGGCDFPNTYGTNQRVTGHNRPQASPCKNCGRRQRLNPGNCCIADDFTDSSDRHFSSRRFLEPPIRAHKQDEHDAWSRKAWAETQLHHWISTWESKQEEKQAGLRILDRIVEEIVSETQDSESEGGDKFE